MAEGLVPHAQSEGCIINSIEIDVRIVLIFVLSVFDSLCATSISSFLSLGLMKSLGLRQSLCFHLFGGIGWWFRILLLWLDYWLWCIWTHAVVEQVPVLRSRYCGVSKGLKVIIRVCS